MPGITEEEIERAFNLAARAMQRRFSASGTEEDIEAALTEFLAPILAESRNATRYADELLKTRSDAAEANALKAMWNDRALAAEAALAAERERCAKIAEAEVSDAIGEDDAAKAYRIACYDCATAIRAQE